MSYILDALKKTEAETDPAAAASLALGEHRAHSLYRIGGIVVAVALLVNAGVLIWLFGPASQPPAPVNSTPGTPAPAVQAAAAESVAPGPAPVAGPAQPPTRSPIPGTVPAGAQPAQRINARLADLPAPVRARFPGLVFSTHIYADDPSLRAVVANGNRLVEGDEISGTTVEQITEDGVVLAFEAYLVEIPVVADWE